MTATVAFCPAPSLSYPTWKGVQVKYLVDSVYDGLRIRDEPTQLFLLLAVDVVRTPVSRVANLPWTTAAHYRETLPSSQKGKKLKSTKDQNITKEINYSVNCNTTFAPRSRAPSCASQGLGGDYTNRVLGIGRHRRGHRHDQSNQANTKI